MATCLQDLSFTAPGKAWAPQRTGDYETDCALGRKCASEFAEFASASDANSLLGVIVSDMVEDGRFTGLEVGFFAGISILLMKN